MAHFDIENLEPSPEEEELKKAKEHEIKEKEKELTAKEVAKEVKIEQTFEKAKKVEEPSAPQEQTAPQAEYQSNQSLFYPLAQGLQDYLTRKAGLEPANDTEREAVRIATLELEQKYGANKINSPEARFIVAEVTPFVRQFNKVLDYLMQRRATPQQENKPVKHEDINPEADSQVPAGFKFNAVQSKVVK